MLTRFCVWWLQRKAIAEEPSRGERERRRISYEADTVGVPGDRSITVDTWGVPRFLNIETQIPGQGFPPELTAWSDDRGRRSYPPQKTGFPPPPVHSPPIVSGERTDERGTRSHPPLSGPPVPSVSFQRDTPKVRADYP